MKKCIIPGSYDPITRGHLELFKSAAKIFDTVYPVILCNSEKRNGMFTPDERLDIMNVACEKLKSEGIVNVVPIVYEGLTTDAALELGADFIVKGVRNSTDFTYEFDLAEISRHFCPKLQTVFIPSLPEIAYISSTYVRELIKYGRFDSPDFADGTVDAVKRILGEH